MPGTAKARRAHRSTARVPAASGFRRARRSRGQQHPGQLGGEIPGASASCAPPAGPTGRRDDGSGRPARPWSSCRRPSARRCDQPVDGRDVDHRPVITGEQQRRHQTAQIQHRNQVDLNDPLQFAQRLIFQRAVVADTGVVDQDVHRPKRPAALRPPPAGARRRRYHRPPRQHRAGWPAARRLARRAVTTISAPASRRTPANRSPRPDEAPVTRATRPERSPLPVSIPSSSQHRHT